MRSATILLLLIAFTQFGSHAACVAPASGAAAEEEKRDLYKKDLGDRAQIVVSRKEVAVNASLRRLLKTDSRTAQFLRAFVITVELRSPGVAPVVLGSKLQWGAGLPAPTTAVLNVIADQGDVIIAFSRGTGIALWRINLDRMSEDAITWLPHGWEVRAAARPTTKESIQVSLGRRGDGRWEAAVLDVSLGHPANPTRYEQDADGWKFHLTRKWDDEDPAAPGLRPSQRK